MNQIFYRIGKILILGILLLSIVNYIVGSKWMQYIPKCYFRSMTGFYCPGCGGTRAFRAVLQFRFWESFCYHPFVLYIIVSYSIFMLQYFLGKRKYNNSGKMIPIDIVMYIGIAVIVVQCLVKNILYLGRGVAWL